MDQSVDALFQFHKQSEVGEVADGAFLLRLDWVTCFDVLPWIGRQLLQSERHFALLAVDAQHHAFDFVVHLQEVLGAAQVL